MKLSCFGVPIFSHMMENQRKSICKEQKTGSVLKDGGGIGRVDHFLSYKFIKRITESRANFTKQLLIAS